MAEAQEKVGFDLNAAREIYLSELRHISDAVRFTADRSLLFEELLAGNELYAGAELEEVRQREGLDVLTITDSQGRVIWRTANPSLRGDSQTEDKLVAEVLRDRQPIAATMIVSGEELQPRVTGTGRAAPISSSSTRPWPGNGRRPRKRQA